MEILIALAGYVPNKQAAFAFSILYGISAVYHEYQISKTKPQRFTTPLSLGACMSLVGYALRRVVITKEDDHLGLWITSQILILGAGPTYAAADYFIAARLFHFVPHAAPIRPFRVVSTFLTFDVLAELFLYAGATSSMLAKNPVGRSVGLWILRLAMCIQAVSFMVFAVMVIVFNLEVKKRGVSGKWKRIIWTLYASSILIITRSIYHIIETFFPYTSSLRTNEAYFIALEATLMLINVGMFNLIHPGFLLPQKSTTHLAEDGTITEGSDFQDTRPMLVRILDPFDLRGMTKKHKQKESEAHASDCERSAA